MWRLADGVYLRSVGVGCNVDVVGSARVVTWVECSELCYTVAIGRLQTTAVGGIDVACIGTVSVSSCDDTAINTGGVGIPEINHDIWDRFAGGYVNDLEVKNEINALLMINLPDIRADKLSRDIVWSFCHFRNQDTRLVACEDDIGARLRSIYDWR